MPRPSSPTSNYVPLRVHGHHSLLTGVDRPAELLARAAQLGLPALALADVDNLAGLVPFLKAGAANSGVRPILAAELSDPNEPGRLVALVRNATGYRNLCKLVSARQLGRDPGQHGADLGSPEEDFDLVRAAAAHCEGLTFLADHPRLLIGLMDRVPREALLAAISPAALRGGARRAGERPPKVRNTHLEARVNGRPVREANRQPDVERLAGCRSSRNPRCTDPHSRLFANPDDSDSLLDAPKTPPPSRAIPAHELIEAARATGFATLAVPDVYHAFPGAARDHAVRVAIKHNALLEGLPAEWLAEQPAHLPTAAEMNALYAELADVPGAWPVKSGRQPAMVARTLAVAESCDYTPALGGVLLPEIELEADETPYSKLCTLAFEGAAARYRPLRPEVVRRLDYELTTIEQLGFAPYFLLVHRISEYARAQSIPCVGRGSAADSLVAYCLRMTDADPFRYELIFERFLNPTRKDRPDIDLDFCWRRRDEVIEHVYELFGAQRTAMICTLNCFGLRSAFRETALVEGIPPAEVNRWSRALPHYPPQAYLESGTPRPFFDGDGAAPEDDEAALVAERPATGEQESPIEASLSPIEASLSPIEASLSPIEASLRATPEARDFPFDDERWQRVIRAAGALLDVPRHFGLHPGGVVVSPGPITDFVSCHRAAKGVVVTQFDKDAVEAIGLVKMDLLGNRALTVLDDCVRQLAEDGIEIELEALDEEDPQTAHTLREGRTLGCFQVESPGMRNLLKQTGAADMNAVIQAVALIRPGPAASGMKDAYVRRFRGLEEPHAPHPLLTDVLWSTQGVMLYQEDVMQVAARLAGMDLAQADVLRRALQKRRHAELRELRRVFLEGCARQGLGRPEAEHVWELISNFASFGFCKAHAVTYGRIAYRAVWLKTHHPAPYIAAFLASDTGYYKKRVYIEEARRLGVAILPPDINRSEGDCTVESDGGALRLGLRWVKGLSGRTLDTLFAARDTGGPFISLPDFLERTGAHTDESENLIQCGAFDAFDHTRPELSWRLHLLRTPKQRPPRDLTRTGGRPLDPDALAACEATPESRTADLLRTARAKSAGWHRGGSLALGSSELGPGESASLFPEPETPALALPGLPNPSRKERGAIEYELLGLTVRDHPLRVFPCPADERIAPLPTRLKPSRKIDCAKLEHFQGGRVTLRGWPAANRRVVTKNGEWMRFLTLEDESGIAEVVLFPDIYRRDGHHLAEFGSLCVTGTVQNQMGACTLEAERIW